MYQAEYRPVDVSADNKDALLAGHSQLAKLDAGFEAFYETDAQKPFLATLKQCYIANGITRARAAAQARGSHAEVVALDAEKAAIERDTNVSEEDAADTPESLKTLRGTYRSAVAKITATRDAKAAPLYNLYLKTIDGCIPSWRRPANSTRRSRRCATPKLRPSHRPALAETRLHEHLFP